MSEAVQGDAASAPHVLCMVLDPSRADCLQELLGAEGPLDLLAPTLTVDLERRIAGQAIRLLDFSGLVEEILPATRDMFVRFLANWPDQYRVGRRTFKEWLRHDDGFSRWWLLEPSQKNPESSPLFRVVCLAEVLRLCLARSHYRQIVLVGGDSTEVTTLALVCRRAGHAVTRVATRRDLENSLPGLIVRRARAAGAAVLRKLAAQRVSAVPGRREQGTRLVAFHTWCPVQWSTHALNPRDRCFVDVPDQLQSRGAEALYACCLSGMSPRRLPAAVRDVRRLPAALTGQMAWIEPEVSWVRLVRIFLDVWCWLRFEILWRFDPRLRASFVLPSGVDIAPVMLRDLRMALAAQLPVMTLLAEQMRGFVRRYRPAQVVTILETYCYGRAVIRGTRQAGVGTEVIGLQHSPVGLNQLCYRFEPSELRPPDEAPLPDHFLIHSTLVEEQLVQSGAARERFHLTGAPRFGALPRYRRERRDNRADFRRNLGLPTDRYLVLLAGTIWPEETERLLELAFGASVDRDVVLIIKLHPLTRGLDGVLNRLRVSYPTVVYEQVTTALQELLVAADVMVTGNSTVDVEALAIGCPVIKLSSALGSSPIDDDPDAVPKAATAEQLAAALDDLPTARSRETLVTRAVGPLDDLIADRVLRVLMGDSVQPQSHRPEAVRSADTRVSDRPARQHA